MAGRKSRVGGTPPIPCDHCHQPFAMSGVVGSRRKSSGMFRICPRCLPIVKAAKKRKKAT